MASYLYTTMGDEGLEANIESSDFKAPMAGFGLVYLERYLNCANKGRYGLPLSRLVGHEPVKVLQNADYVPSMLGFSVAICGSFQWMVMELVSSLSTLDVQENDVV